MNRCYGRGILKVVVDFSALLERIDDQCRRAAHARPGDGGTLEAIEDLLSEGYVVALSGESHSRRLADRVLRLAHGSEEPKAAGEARELVLEKRSVDLRVRLLRARLRDLREHLRRLAGPHPLSG